MVCLRNRFFHKPIFHIHSDKKEKKVTWLELFYDLVYVAAFIQLGDAFSNDISANTFFKSAGIFGAMWLSWTGFTYYANRFTIDDFLHRTLVFIQMFCVGAMAISIPDLMNDNPIVFGLAYAFSLFTISALYLRSIVQQTSGRDYAIYWGKVFLLSGLFWALSLFSQDFYYVGWVLGACVVFIGPMTSRAIELSEYYPFDLEHLSERYGLLTIIVLGESFVKVLSQLSATGAGIYEILQACFALLLTCALWWIYFDDIASTKLKKSKNSMVTWLFTHMPLQLSVVLMGVGIKKVISLPLDSPLPLKYSLLLGGSIGAAFISTSLIDSVTYRKNSELNEATRIYARFFSGVFVIVLAIVSPSMNNLWFISGCLFVCISQVVFDIIFSPNDFEDEEDVISLQDIDQTITSSIPSTLKTGLQREPVMKGLPTDYKKDLYYYFIESSWVQLLIAFFFIYIVSNAFFAGLYLMDPESLSTSDKSFAQAFFFSVQTMSTIGFGVLSPESLYANIIVVIEAAFGIVGVATITGVIFERISKPNAKILFTNNIVHSLVDGKKSISFRMSNTRGNDIIEASLSLSALIDETTKEGNHIRRIRDLKLVRSKTPFFKLSWLATHEIDEESPLYNLDLSSAKLVTIVATLTGHDGTYSNTIYAQKSYYSEDVVQDKYFEDIMYYLPDGRMMIDYDKFNLLIDKKLS